MTRWTRNPALASFPIDFFSPYILVNIPPCPSETFHRVNWCKILMLYALPVAKDTHWNLSVLQPSTDSWRKGYWTGPLCVECVLFLICCMRWQVTVALSCHMSLQTSTLSSVCDTVCRRRVSRRQEKARRWRERCGRCVKHSQHLRL